jgi:Fic family protein
METKFFTLDQKLDHLRQERLKTLKVAPQIVADFDEKLDLSWIFHDNALEGIVLSYHELKAAIDKKIISDVTLIPMYEEIKLHKQAIEYVRALARTWAAESTVAGKKPRRVQKSPITLDLIKTLHGILTPDEKAKGSPYRKENPLHRTYFHEISQPDKILLRMKKLVEWLDEDEALNLHPIDRAARAHQKFMSTFPWLTNTGKVGRLVMNLMLLKEGYPPAVVHSIERQRYYDVLRNETAGIVPLILESVDNAVETATRFFSEFDDARRSARSERRAS